MLETCFHWITWNTVCTYNKQFWMEIRWCISQSSILYSHFSCCWNMIVACLATRFVIFYVCVCVCFAEWSLFFHSFMFPMYLLIESAAMLIDKLFMRLVVFERFHLTTYANWGKTFYLPTFYIVCTVRSHRFFGSVGHVFIPLSSSNIG